MENTKNILQLVWGMLLTSAGIGMFISIPQKMKQIAEQSEVVTLFTYISLYLIGIILFAGGTRKIYSYFKKPDDKD